MIKFPSIKCSTCDKERIIGFKCIKCGRPTSWKGDNASIFLEHISRGGSICSFSKLIGVSRTTLYNWIRTRNEFRLAFYRGRYLRDLNKVSELIRSFMH